MLHLLITEGIMRGILSPSAPHLLIQQHYYLFVSENKQDEFNPPSALSVPRLVTAHSYTGLLSCPKLLPIVQVVFSVSVLHRVALPVFDTCRRPSFGEVGYRRSFTGHATRMRHSVNRQVLYGLGDWVRTFAGDIAQLGEQQTEVE